MAVKGYTFDRMANGPKSDALLYHTLNMQRDTIVKKYLNELKVTSSGLNIYIDKGACIVKGRFIENDEMASLNVLANSQGHIVVTIDLGQVNTSSGISGTPDYIAVNNQLRLEVIDNLIQQNILEDGQIFMFPLASYKSTGSSVTLTIVDHDKDNPLMTDTERNKLKGIQTGAQVNRTIATRAQAEAGTDNTTVMTPLSTKQATDLTQTSVSKKITLNIGDGMEVNFYKIGKIVYVSIFHTMSGTVNDSITLNKVIPTGFEPVTFSTMIIDAVTTPGDPSMNMTFYSSGNIAFRHNKGGNYKISSLASGTITYFTS